ncbi:hypothetical protein GCM10025864_12890 [Luteimicrobium album]|uniref:Uncharacterized protein n=1 Tax=Luteimicrobium album TaxID=1054550 RepID=A0ABQ6HYE5_9MICO|nr:hypothetical protein GCM10025864_12890 [Luteimicrobium album]
MSHEPSKAPDGSVQLTVADLEMASTEPDSDPLLISDKTVCGDVKHRPAH